LRSSKEKKLRGQFGCCAGSRRGAVLMEVILALVLFVGAATVITGAFNASVNSVERLRLQTHAANLAVTVLSEMQMGILPVESAGPEPFEAPFERWTWETQVSALDGETFSGGQLNHVEVIVRLEEESMVYRLAQAMPFRAASEEATVQTRNSRTLDRLAHND